MEDSISKNLNFKFIIFITLLGTWWGLLGYYTVISLESSKQVISLCLIIVSFFVFCPLVHITLMLIYTSLYQVSEKEKIKKELKNKYKKSSKIFFEWWALALVVAPILLIIAIFPEPVRIISFVSIIIYLIIMLRYYFNGIFIYEDVEKYCRNCGWWLIPYWFIFFIAQYLAKTLK